MKATITGIEEKKSYMGDVFYYFFFKMEDGKSARSCVYKKFGNFQRWAPLVTKFRALKDGDPAIMLDKLNLKGRMVDADSFFSIVK
jgi:hypothetical protein